MRFNYQTLHSSSFCILLCFVLAHEIRACLSRGPDTVLFLLLVVLIYLFVIRIFSHR